MCIRDSPETVGQLKRALLGGKFEEGPLCWQHLGCLGSELLAQDGARRATTGGPELLPPVEGHGLMASENSKLLLEVQELVLGVPAFSVPQAVQGVLDDLCLAPPQENLG
eukprot:10851134-Lingulodinium_polyedra.AAC.1